MAFKDIIGQERALAILQACIARKRVPHALLFSGEEGIGKKLTAVNFAKSLNCQEAGQGTEDLFVAGGDLQQSEGSHDSCDACSSCGKIDRGIHPDVHVVAPEGDGGQIKVASVRKIQETLSYKPFEGEWKTVIVDQADKLNPSAANAFLETLEAPPAQSAIILISSRPDLILRTIRSRCQRINFTPLPLPLMSAFLEQTSGHDAEAAALLSMLSGGRIGLAFTEYLLPRRDDSLKIMREMLSGLHDNLWQDKEHVDDWFEWVQLWLRDMAVFLATGRADLLLNQDRKREIKDLAERASLRDLLILSRELYNIKDRLRFHLNRQVTLNYTTLLLRRLLNKGNATE